MALNKKILLIIPTYLPILGGAELAVHNIAKALNTKGVNADVLTFNIKKKRWQTSLKTEIEYVEGIKVHYLGALNLLFLLRGKYRSVLLTILGVQLIPSIKLYKFIKGYDIIHFNDEVNLSIPFFLLFSKKKKIFHIRTLVPLFKGFQKFSFSRWVLRHVSNKFIVETGEYIKLLKELGIQDEQMIFWKKGVNTAIFTKKNIFNNKNNKIINLLTIGRFSDSNKGFDIILDALLKLDCEAKLRIISPKFKENAYSQELRRKMAIINRDKDKCVELIINVEQKKLVNYYNEAEIFVFTPRKDSMPNVLLEASSCELPIIASKVGGIPEIIKDGETGLLIEPKCPDELAEKICYLFKDRNLMLRLGKKARAHIVENFSQENAINNLIKIYEGL